MTIAITGHRPNKLGNDYSPTSDLIKKIKFKIQHILTEYNHIGRRDWSPVTLITGMALGIDTLFALLAIENKLPFIAAIPCQGQSSVWPQKSKEVYLDIINHPLCTKHYVSLGPYSPQKMQIRNEWMVDNCDVLIAVWDGSNGGTNNCVKYAQSKGKKIIEINPKSL